MHYNLARSFLKLLGNVRFEFAVSLRMNRLTTLLTRQIMWKKGGNSTVSMLHHYLENHGVKEEDIRL